MIFLSTPSARRATAGKLIDQRQAEISIHALREEGDGFSYKTVAFNWVFLSTPSARRATHALLRLHAAGEISIHALREEGDVEGVAALRHIINISIHALREEGDDMAVEEMAELTISIHALREEGDKEVTI